MADGGRERARQGVEPLGDEVAVMRSGTILVLDGSREVIDRLIAGDPALRSARPVRSSSTAAIGALAALEPLMGLAARSPTAFQLDAAGQAMFDSGSLTAVGDGFFRLFAKAADGTISGHGALRPLVMGPQQLATAQLALATVALTAAIKEVQQAVERVEDKVDLLRDILDAERQGDVIGANRSLRRRAEHMDFDGTMSDADWHAIDDIGITVEQQIEQLRSFIRKRLVSAEDEGLKISGRLDAVEHTRDVAETLALLVVAQDSLFLFQQMRVLRIKATQPEYVPTAVEEARALLDEHAAEDADLLQRLRALVADRVKVEALEVLRFRTASEIARIAPQVDETLAWFADQRALRYESFEVPPLPGAADVVDEVKERGAVLAWGGKRAIGGLADRIRSLKDDDSEGLAVESGDAPPELPVRSGDAVEVEVDEVGGQILKARLSSLSRIRRSSGRDAADVSDVVSDPDSSALDDL